jgi:RNase P subunit RPR2
MSFKMNFGNQRPTQLDRYVKIASKLERSKCSECEEPIYEGDSIVWDIKERKAYCKECGEELMK